MGKPNVRFQARAAFGASLCKPLLGTKERAMKRIDSKTDAEIENMPLVPENELGRDWWVYSTAIEDKVLLVECRKTGERGYVADPTLDEWRNAFHAPSNPYPWSDNVRVVIDPNTCPPFDEATKQAALERSRS